MIDRPGLISSASSIAVIVRPSLIASVGTVAVIVRPGLILCARVWFRKRMRRGEVSIISASVQ